jgi:hypothetical protein
MKGGQIHAHSGYNIYAIQKQFMVTASLIKKKSGNSTFIRDST